MSCKEFNWRKVQNGKSQTEYLKDNCETRIPTPNKRYQLPKKKSKLEKTSNDCHVIFDTADVLQEQKGNFYKLKLLKLCDVGNI